MQEFRKDAGKHTPINITNAWCASNVPWEHTCLEASIFSCVPNSSELTPPQRAGVGVAATAAVLALLVIANVCMVNASWLRRMVTRARYRLAGAPRHGRMSLVITDIEGYSGG